MMEHFFVECFLVGIIAGLMLYIFLLGFRSVKSSIDKYDKKVNEMLDKRDEIIKKQAKTIKEMEIWIDQQLDKNSAKIQEKQK